MASDNRFWPFDCSTKGSGNILHSDEAVSFFETAYREGFRPYLNGLDYFASRGRQRSGALLRRGVRRHWEVILHERARKVAFAHVQEFTVSAAALLEWLRGKDAMTAMENCKQNLVKLTRGMSNFLVETEISGTH